MFGDAEFLEALGAVTDNNQAQSAQSNQFGYGSDQSPSIQQLGQYLQQAQQAQQQPQVALGQQMQQLQQMSMLSNFGQYNQIGSMLGHSSSNHNNHQDQFFVRNDYDKPQRPSQVDNRAAGGGKMETGKKGKPKKKSNVKRPTTAYLYFVSKFREILKNTGEKYQAKEIMPECGSKWRSMDDEDKKPYQALADQDKERWRIEKAAEKKPKDERRPKRPPSAYFLFLKDFRALWKLENDVPEEPEIEEVDTIEAPKIGSGLGDSGVIDNTTVETVENDDSNTIMTIEVNCKKVKKERKTPRVVEITKKAGEKWNSMNEEDKAPYVAQALELRLNWEKRLNIYKHELKLEQNGEVSALNDIGDGATVEDIVDMPTLSDIAGKMAKVDNMSDTLVITPEIKTEYVVPLTWE